MSTDPNIVWLVYSSNVNDGQLIDRSRLPDEAERFTMEFHPANLGLPDQGTYEVWVVDDAAEVTRDPVTQVDSGDRMTDSE